MAFHSSRSWQACLLPHALTAGGKKPRAPCCGRLHPCVSSLAVPRPSHCCLHNDQPGPGTPGSRVLHRSNRQHCLKSSVSTLYSCHQTARVTRSYLTQQWGIFLLPPVAWQTIPVSDTQPHGKEPWWPCHPVIPRVPGNTLGLGTLGTGIVWGCPRPVHSSLRHFSCCWVMPDSGDSKIFLVLWGPPVRWFAPNSLRLPEWRNMEDPY